MLKLHAVVSEGNLHDVKEYIRGLEETQLKREINSYLNGDTPMHIAAWCGNLPIVTLLLENGADPEAKNSFGVTPLTEVKCVLSEMGAGEKDRGLFVELQEYLSFRKRVCVARKDKKTSSH